jgi:hypothetical protein
MRRIFSIIVFGLLLPGCAGLDDWDKRSGPDPSVPQVAVSNSVGHQHQIITALYSLTECNDGRKDDACRYQVTVAGFNFIDEQCDAYLRELFILDKERNRARTFLTAADKLTSVILSATPASKATMGIVAQAFGFSTSYLDAATDSYLYKTNSGNILHVVAELQKAYRDQTGAHKELLTSEPDVYAQIRGYLRLCMPPTIESKIEEVISASTAKPAENDTGPGTNQDASLIAASAVSADTSQ